MPVLRDKKGKLVKKWKIDRHINTQKGKKSDHVTFEEALDFMSDCDSDCEPATTTTNSDQT